MTPEQRQTAIGVTAILTVMVVIAVMYFAYEAYR